MASPRKRSCSTVSSPLGTCNRHDDLRHTALTDLGVHGSSCFTQRICWALTGSNRYAKCSCSTARLLEDPTPVTMRVLQHMMSNPWAVGVLSLAAGLQPQRVWRYVCQALQAPDAL